ncbi:hypothetical protein GGU11DRAFT_862762 [Lentinula aff. detonsa]|nr:hypothetical protein GGU11DRAFT_862762 [Lentinula aff. detonsa]
MVYDYDYTNDDDFPISESPGPTKSKFKSYQSNIHPVMQSLVEKSMKEEVESSFHRPYFLSSDILDEVISISHFNPSPQPRSSLSLNRRQVEDNQILSSAPITTTRADKEGQYVAAPDVMERHHLLIMHKTPRSFDLPLNTNDLGSLPIYQPFDWSVPQAQLLSASDETQFNSWASTMASDTNQFGLHAKPLSSYMDLESEEHSIVPSQSIGEELPSCNSVANDLDDWASYIATIDEILQAMNTRVA